ncbi:MAG: hypothetical protein ABI432_09455 [Flavobacteriales bacterium]
MRAFVCLLALITAPIACLAQTDTVRTDEGHMQSLEIGMTHKDGMGVRMVDGDTVTNKGSWTIDTRYKRITVTTVPKPWASVNDSVAEVLKDLRTQRRNQFTYWSGLDLGVNTLLGSDGDADLDASADFMQIDNAKSRFFAINFMEEKIEFGSHHVGLLTGLGLEFTSYHLANNVTLQYNADSVYGVPMETPELRKNKLRQTGLRLPLMLEFNTKRARMPAAEEVLAAARDTVKVLKKGQHKPFEMSNKGNFHIAVGVVGSWYFATMYKQKYELNEDPQKDRSSGDYHMLPYRAAASVRIGYGHLNLFAEYSLTPLFEDGKGPELTPLNIGLTIIGFN